MVTGVESHNFMKRLEQVLSPDAGATSLAGSQGTHTAETDVQKKEGSRCMTSCTQGNRFCPYFLLLLPHKVVV